MALDVTFLGHPEARNVEEIWAGKTNIKERRRLQNRLNRRAYRKRQVEHKSDRKRTMEDAGIVSDKRPGRNRSLPGVAVFALDVKYNQVPMEPISLTSLISASRKSAFTNKGPVLQSSRRHLRLLQSWCRKFEETMAKTALISIEPGDGGASASVSDAVLFEEGLIRNGHLGSCISIPGPEDQLINLMYYNVFRGLSTNIRALNLDLQLMGTSEYNSPFVTGEVDLSLLAPDFIPTYLQRNVVHHPCLDIFPDSVVRDNSILYWYVEKNPLESRLCMALAGRHTWYEMDLALKSGCVLWGEPDVVESWEVTMGFARDWPFLLKGALRLEAATNRYRALRGEPPISFA